MDIISKQLDPAGIYFMQIQLPNGKIIEIEEIDDDAISIAGFTAINENQMSHLTIDKMVFYDSVIIK